MTTIITIQTKTICLVLSLLTLFVVIPTPKTLAKTTATQTCYAPTGTNDALSFSDARFRTNWSGAYQCRFNKFNPSLGLLKKVNTTLSGSVLASVSVENEDVGTYSKINISNTAEANINLKNPFDNNSDILVAIPSKSMSGDLSSYDNVTDFSGTSGRADKNITATDTKSTSIISSTFLPNFIGSDTYVLPVSTIGKSGCTGGGNLVCKNQTFASGIVTLSYDYDPSLMPITNPTPFTNAVVNENVDLSTALSVNNPDNLIITRYTIKTVPNPALGIIYYKDTNGISVPVTQGISLTVDQAKTLYFKPNIGSEGQKFNFTYTATTPDSIGKDLESSMASVGINLLDKVPVVPTSSQSTPTKSSIISSTANIQSPSSGMSVITIGNNSNNSNNSSTSNQNNSKSSQSSSSVDNIISNTTNNNISNNPAITNLKLSKDINCVSTIPSSGNNNSNNSSNNKSTSQIPTGSTDITNCFPISIDLDHYTTTDIKLGANTTGSGIGNFFLIKSNGDKIKLNDNQDVVITDSQVVFIPSSERSCTDCTVSLNIKSIDQKGNTISTTPVIFTLGNNGTFGGIGGGLQIDDSNLATVRTGGFTQQIKENWTLLLVLLLSVAFFFSSISKTQIQRVFTKKLDDKSE